MTITRTVSKAADGPLVGFAVLALSVPLLLAALAACVAKCVRYGLGSKAPQNDKDPVFSETPDFHAIDCSGFVRWALWVATRGRVLIPDGSYVQHDWFEDNDFKRTDYSNAALRDGHLRIAFHSPGGRGGDGTGHVWLIFGGFTLESFGGHGPGRRNWDHEWFVSHVDACYVVC